MGTVLNVGTVLAGASVGTVLGERLPERMRTTVMHALGLVTILLGVREALGTRNVMMGLGALVIGALIGEALRLEERLPPLRGGGRGPPRGGGGRRGVS